MSKYCMHSKQFQKYWGKTRTDCRNYALLLAICSINVPFECVLRKPKLKHPTYCFW